MDVNALPVAPDRTELREFINSKRNYINEDGCWFLTEQYNKESYKVVRWGGEQKAIHILAAIAFLGHTFGSPLNVCHKCDMKGCFNPDHLFIGTDSDNHKDALRKKKIKEVNEKLGLVYNRKELAAVRISDFRIIKSNKKFPPIAPVPEFKIEKPIKKLTEEDELKLRSELDLKPGDDDYPEWM